MKAGNRVLEKEGHVYSIYALVDPREDDVVRYVGMTDDIYRRFREHLAMDGKNPQKDAWISMLQSEQVMLSMQRLDVCEDYQEALALERKWIDLLLAEGQPLLNIVGITHASPRNTQKQFRTGRHHTNEEIDAILDAYLLDGTLPQHVSVRQKYTYRHHPRLKERLRMLQQEGYNVT